ncbi:cell wall anchor protein [Winogradskyella sp.]|uniref:cell wall anchor protein n=1 Tax=Winogradskyella sp. TaxID=1883156 RepID=UPI00351690B9
MKNLNQKLVFIKCLIVVSISFNSFAQVGIGTLNPDASSMLDVSSTSKGMLAPRMTSAQRVAIANPANGLLVYDTTESSFYYYNSSQWVSLKSNTRDNYKLVKSVADLSDELTAGGGSKYLLSENTFYEINGTISLAYPIDINNAFISGRDTYEDVLLKTGGTMFVSSKGGVIKNTTMVAAGGTVFNFTGTSADNLIIRDAVVANSNAVGSISGFPLVFMSIVQFVGNSNGITYTDIDDLLISNTGWQSSNSGVYETYSGTFDFIQKQGGYMIIDGTDVGIDVSSNPSINNAVLTGVSFSGTSSQYVDGYSVGSYTGYNFDNSWTVNCPGIPVESDQVSGGNIYYDGTITTGFVQSITNNSPLNLRGNSNSNTTTLVNELRTMSAQDNRITYTGEKTRTFQVNAALSIRGNSGVGDYYAFFIRKNGTTTLTETNTLMRVNNTSDISSNAISGTVELAPNDYIEIWGQRLTGSGTTSITVFSLNLSIQ